MQEGKKKKNIQFWKAIAMILKAFTKLKNKIFSGWKRKKERDRRRKDINELIKRLKSGERVNPMCQYADCLLSFKNCALFEKCLVKELERCSK